jgi:hypothetical protein
MDEMKIGLGVLALISMASVLMIVPLCAMISYGEHMQLELYILFGVVFLMTFFLTKICLQLVTDVIDISKEFSNSYLRAGAGTLTKYEKLSIQCCTPIQYDIEPFSTVTKETFPNLMSNVVVNRVIDFVIASN